MKKIRKFLEKITKSVILLSMIVYLKAYQLIKTNKN
ncbi:hypothetical protein BCO_0900020 (plasmid) [Borrelia coriaceae ATCC 43381]|uniref:Uncharacterized protein n=1 Tax=Borrelia coriaceae ATCC 43381 TaxID=1408429 RepID=W5SVW1_9SPIR|nr:hypothetical protein BCO_0900020 [Borrelia coriaceae ATCC 43381]